MVSTNHPYEQNEIINEIMDDLSCNKPTELKPGIKLPKTDTQWIYFSESNYLQET